MADFIEDEETPRRIQPVHLKSTWDDATLMNGPPQFRGILSLQLHVRTLHVWISESMKASPPGGFISSCSVIIVRLV